VPETPGLYVERCFLVYGKWIDYTVYFRNGDEAQRLIDILMNGGHRRCLYFVKNNFGKTFGRVGGMC